MLRRAHWFVPIFGVIAVLAWPTPTHAHKTFMAFVKDTYHLDEKRGKCLFCHGEKKGPSKTNLNPYGLSIQSDAAMKPLLGKKTSYVFSPQEIAILKTVVTAQDDKDADGDGASNKEETLLGTLPGDPKSTPAKANLDTFRKNQEKAAAKK